MKDILKEKIRESFSSIAPICLVVLLLAISFTPLKTGALLLFALGAVLLVVGTALFTLGADQSMLVIGQRVGATLTKSKKVWLIAFISFVIGVIVTIAEPDLQILAEQVPDVENMVLILTVSVGVGIFLMIAMLRILFGIRLKYILAFFYPILFLVAVLFVPSSFWALSFDSGGVTTGPVTVPFIMSLGVGVAAVRADKKGGGDSFGLVALASLGPILAVLILGIVCKVNGGVYTPTTIEIPNSTTGLFKVLSVGFLEYCKEVAIALAPIAVFTLLFQAVTKVFHKRQFLKVSIGMIYSFLGLSFFLTGAGIGFLPVGSEIGSILAKKWNGALLVPVGMIFGYFVVAAEPAVYVLNKQVERMSAGAVTASAMKKGLCLGVCVALGFAMLRILVGFNILYVLVPGYLVALALMPFTPDLFTGIAFDSGGVASGAMVSSFILPMAIGSCSAIAPSEVMTLAFGCIALVALAPLISIQVLGIVYKHKASTYKKNFLAEEDVILEYEV